MKRLFVIFGIIFILIMQITGCSGQRPQYSCKLFIYSGVNKIYQINFDGRDSIETICGTYILSHYDSLKKNGYIIRPFGLKTFHLETIYLRKAKKLDEEQACQLSSILCRLNSKVITDTIKGEIRDVWNIYLSLEKQNVELQMVGIKDHDIQLLVDSLVEYSPLFINMYSNTWFGIENEQEMIRMYDRRRK